MTPFAWTRPLNRLTALCTVAAAVMAAVWLVGYFGDGHRLRFRLLQASGIGLLAVLAIVYRRFITQAGDRASTVGIAGSCALLCAGAATSDHAGRLQGLSIASVIVGFAGAGMALWLIAQAVSRQAYRLGITGYRTRIVFLSFVILPFGAGTLNRLAREVERVRRESRAGA